jgi:hypothetical protein
LHQQKNWEDENGENFCIWNPILANLGFFKSSKKDLSNGDHKFQGVRHKIPNKEVKERIGKPPNSKTQ